MTKTNNDFLAIMEMKRKGKVMQNVSNGYWMYWSGVNKEENSWGSDIY